MSLLVAHMRRILRNDDVLEYRSDAKRSNGKLRVLGEFTPMSLLNEQAASIVTVGHHSA